MPRPARTPDGHPCPQPPDIVPSPVPDPSKPDDLSAALQQITGCALDALEPDESQLARWNQALTRATHTGFEHRTLVGVAINALRPRRGSVTAYNERIAELLGRNIRWVRDTANVASVIEEAIAEQLPRAPGVRGGGGGRGPGGGGGGGLGGGGPGEPWPSW